MKYIHIIALSAVAAVSLVGCNNENPALYTQENKSNDLRGVTVATYMESTSTRTTAEYETTKLAFYWTRGDKVWLHDIGETPEFVQNSGDNIDNQLNASGKDKVRNAGFYFPTPLNKASYPVRYTGYPTPAVDKVTIKAAQNQAKPNKGEHIKTDGDCGVGSFTRGADGNYSFYLKHCASYLTFTPFFSKGFAPSVRLTQIKVSADQAIAGTYDIEDSGLDLDSRPLAEPSNRNITLTLNGGGNDGFTIPAVSTPETNAGIMVVAPGEYTNFTIEYTLYDQETKVRGTVITKLGHVILKEGRNKRLSPDLDVRYYASDQYYMWDAQPGEHYWKGASKQPYLNGKYGDSYAKVGADPRWYNTVAHPGKASRLATNNLNANELMWLAYYGVPHWDSSMWTIMGHLYAGGMWLRNLDVIATTQKTTRERMKAVSPKGIDFTAYAQYDNFGAFVYTNNNIIPHRPRPTNGYFFLPTTGFYNNGRLYHISSRGYIWSSTPRAQSSSKVAQGYNFYISRYEVHTGYGDRWNGIYQHVTR
ncbi:hypothetical protein [Prevotella sp. oral taxon 317]|uniref:hypothetical protein n=1 Tax=Prevotella sp. oral taxon 317 TaxID=652721 RepID=UPI0001C4083C|nr:hypothetical protein [Prevotella sp. oral taxon 317]EFC68608.1 hypothetical protein HMPREF0670_01779 [Prevotella sp. oral taxon 317 str. F0108]